MPELASADTAERVTPRLEKKKVPFICCYDAVDLLFCKSSI